MSAPIRKIHELLHIDGIRGVGAAVQDTTHQEDGADMAPSRVSLHQPVHYVTNPIIRFNEPDMKSIHVEHRAPKDFSDRLAIGLVRLLRWGTDIATGYHHDTEEPKKASDGNAVVEKPKPYRMSERKWLIRFLFL